MTSEDMAEALEAARLDIEAPVCATTRSVLLAHALMYERARADAERAARKAEEAVWFGAMNSERTAATMEPLLQARRVTWDALLDMGVDP